MLWTGRTIFYFVVLVLYGMDKHLWCKLRLRPNKYSSIGISEPENNLYGFFRLSGLAGIILLIDYKMYNFFAYFIYVFTIFLLIITIFVAPDIKGSRSWLVIGPISFQPAELAKMATSLALARFMSSYNYKLKKWKDLIPLSFFILLPFLLIILQKETGSALVFVAFLLMLYREGMNGIILLITLLAIILFVVVVKFSIVPVFMDQGSLGILLSMGIILLIQFFYAFFITQHRKEALMLLLGTVAISIISFVFSIWFKMDFDIISFVTVIGSVFYWTFIELFNRFKKYWLLIFISLGATFFCFSSDYLFNKVLEPHQQVRIKVLLNMEDDLHGAGYNVNQSKIAIGSGGFWGKGFLNGTQTKLKYVPEQDTDFIFCTVGEEHGFWGSTLVLIIYWLLLMRLLKIAERQRESFNRIYAYCVTSILFFPFDD